MRFEMNTGWKPPLTLGAALRRIPVQVTSTRSIGKIQIVRREVGDPHQLFEAVNNCAVICIPYGMLIAYTSIRLHAMNMPDFNRLF